MSANPRSFELIAVGALLSLASAAGLVGAAVLIPVRYLGDLGDPQGVPQVIRSFQSTWLGTTVALAAVYAAGLGLVAFARRRPNAEPGPGFLPRALGVLLLLAAGFWLFVAAVLGQSVPVAVTSVPVVWSLMLVAFLGTALWGRMLRALGIALTVAGGLLACWAILVSGAIVDGGGALYGLLWDLVSESGGLSASRYGEISFLSRGAFITPVASATFLVLGLALLLLPRGGRTFTASRGSLAVAALLLVSSAVLTQTMRVVLLAHDAELPELTSSWLNAVDGVDAMPPPPPPAPPALRSPR